MSQEALPEPLSYKPCYDFSMLRIPKSGPASQVSFCLILCVFIVPWPNVIK